MNSSAINRDLYIVSTSGITIHASTVNEHWFYYRVLCSVDKISLSYSLNWMRSGGSVSMPTCLAPPTPRYSPSSTHSSLYITRKTDPTLSTTTDPPNYYCRHTSISVNSAAFSMLSRRTLLSQLSLISSQRLRGAHKCFIQSVAHS